MILGEKVFLKALNYSDSPKLLEWVNDPTLKYLTGTIYPVSDMEHKKWFENRICDATGKMFGIEDKFTGELIGVIGLKSIDFINRNAELYIYIGDKNYWGEGLGTEATKLLISFAFNELNLHRIYLMVFSYNTRAIKSYEKVGFKKEGIMRESIYKAGKYHDKIFMGIINK